MWRYDDLAIFVSVVERGSFSAAAKKMKMPSSTVSRRLICLEADLNVKLLERTSRKIHLTEKGKTFFSQCLPLIQKLRESTHKLIESAHEIDGKLKITAPTYVGNELMSDLFTDFVKQNPDIELEILLSNDIEDILDEEIDIAIRIGPLKDSSLIAQHLWDIDYVLCASNVYIFENGMPQKLQELQSEHRMIFRTHQIPLVFRNRESSIEESVNTKSQLISNDIKFTIHAVCNDVGIACLPRMFIRNELESGRLVEVLPAYELMNKKTVYAVYPSKRYLPKKTKLLIQYIKEKSALLSKPAHKRRSTSDLL
ncbi:Transcriptional regulator, LysR family [hydrothermal vent metagenome]|uniref:Transcriptional regulator, LysR family n=1 Tax=hydrothermal vent metagenome TaxID=652676 RepID=A0A3B0XVR2_9ZZZZ